MKQISIKNVLLFFFMLTLFSACKKEEMVESFLRGGNSLLTTDDGNLLIAGYNTSLSKGYEATLIKADQSDGDTIWSYKYGDSYSDAFYCVKKAHFGGYIATGFSNKSASGSPSMLVVITDAAGKQLTSKKYGGSYYSQGLSALTLTNSDSGYLVSGYIQKSSTSDRDIYLVRIKNSGDTLWTKTIGISRNDLYDTINEAAYSVIEAPGGGFFVSGSINGYSNGGGKVFLMKVSSAGKSLWTKTYHNGIGYTLLLTGDSKIVIGGTSMISGNQDIFIMKTDTAGTILKGPATFGGSGFEFGTYMIETSDGGFAITGITESEGAGSQDIYLVKTSSDLVKTWAKPYGGTDIDQGYGLVQTVNGDFCVAGLSNSGGSYIFLNKINQDGTQLWFKNIK
jgi:hypothetical protein